MVTKASSSTGFGSSNGPNASSSAHAYLPALKSLQPQPQGRVRTPVGHRYLEALQSAAAADTDSSSSMGSGSRRSSRDEEDEEGLDLLVLGITSGTAMDDIDFALCRFIQATPEAPLLLDIIQVGSTFFNQQVFVDQS